MESLIRKALDAAGYIHEPATEEALRECFADYVDAGFWSNVDIEDIADFSAVEICREFIRLK